MGKEMPVTERLLGEEAPEEETKTRHTVDVGPPHDPGPGEPPQGVPHPAEKGPTAIEMFMRGMGNPRFAR